MPCPFTVQSLIKLTILKMMALLTVMYKYKACRFVLFSGMVCFISLFDQTLAEQLYRDKGL